VSSGGNRHHSAHVYLNESDSKLFSNSLYQNTLITVNVFNIKTYIFCFHFLQNNKLLWQHQWPLGRSLSAVVFFGFCGSSVGTRSGSRLDFQFLQFPAVAVPWRPVPCSLSNVTLTVNIDWVVCEPETRLNSCEQSGANHRKLCCLHTWVSPKAGKM